MSTNIESVIAQFSSHKTLLERSREDFLLRENSPLYSFDFAVLYPYIVPRVLQRGGNDPLSRISNNLFLQLNERIELFPFQLIIPFATVLEIIEHFGQQKSYLEKVSNSTDFAEAVKLSLLTGSNSAKILEDEVLSRHKLHLPAEDSYKCLQDFVRHLKSGRLSGYGDHFDYSEFKTFIKRNGDFSSMKESLLKVRDYNQSSADDRAFHMDMDALHLLVSRFFNDYGTLYTGPSSTRRTFGRDQGRYSRSPRIPLVLLHAINQAADPSKCGDAALEFLDDGIAGYKRNLDLLNSINNIEDIPPHKLRMMGEFDRVFRSDIFLDRRKKTNQMTPEEVQKAIKGMSTDAVRDSHKKAVGKLSDSVSGIEDIFREEIDEDLADFLSPEGKNHVESIFQSLKL